MVTSAPPGVPNDASGKTVGRWVDALLPPLEDLLSSSMSTHTNISVAEYLIPPGVEDALAWRCAVEIAASRLRYWPSQFLAWFAGLTDVHAPDPKRQARMRLTLCKNLGSPAKPSPDSHLCGLVGESLLGSILARQDRGLGLPILFEGHDWSVTDPGGDCLVVMSHNEELRFQLWECKSIYGTTATGTVIRDAAEQMHEHAAEYLGRYATVAERDALQGGVADMLLRLQDLWIDDDPSKFAGVSVSTHHAKCTDGSFAQLEPILGLPAGRSHGSYTSATNFLAFANQVRDLVWKGCGLV